MRASEQFRPANLAFRPSSPVAPAPFTSTTVASRVGGRARGPASGRGSGESAVLRFFATFINAPWPMTRGEGVVASTTVALAGAVITAGLIPIARMYCSTIPREPRAFAATVFTLLIVASALVTIAAVTTLVSELIGWLLDASDATNAARRSATHREAVPPVTATFTTAQPTGEEVAAELLRNALAKRDEALREAERIERVLHLIDQEISK
jgi:hypothetical protein